MFAVPRLHIFHTNDFHGKLTDEKAARLKVQIECLSEGEPSVILDAGDAISAGNLGFNPLGELTLARMSALGYDAMTMGNRETHPSLAVVRTKLNKATFPVLCGNGYAKRNGNPMDGSHDGKRRAMGPSAVRFAQNTTNPDAFTDEVRGGGANAPHSGTFTVHADMPRKPEVYRPGFPFVSSVVLERGGKRIGIFGVTVPMATPQKVDAALWDNLFAPPIETAKRLAAELRPQCDFLIALTHIGIAQDRKLAEAVPELDLLIGGHTHVVLEQPELVNGVPIVQAGSHGRYLGHVIMEDGNVTGELISL